MLRLGALLVFVGLFSGAMWGIARATSTGDRESPWQREYGEESMALGRALFVLLVPAGLLIIVVSAILD
jgi:hypothetical protein